MDQQAPDALQGASAECCGSSPGLQGTRTGCNTHRSRKSRQPFLFAVPGRISGRIPGHADPFLRPDHSLQKYVPSIARHFLPSPFVAIVPTFSSEPKPHGTPGAQNTRNTDHIPSPPAATPGNFFPVIPTDMTSSLSPRTFRPPNIMPRACPASCRPRPSC